MTLYARLLTGNKAVKRGTGIAPSPTRAEGSTDASASDMVRITTSTKSTKVRLAPALLKEREMRIASSWFIAACVLVGTSPDLTAAAQAKYGVTTPRTGRRGSIRRARNTPIW